MNQNLHPVENKNSRFNLSNFFTIAARGRFTVVMHHRIARSN